MFRLNSIKKDVKCCMKTRIKKDAKDVYDWINQNSMPIVTTFGNGGSAAIAQHMEVDWTKNSEGKWNVDCLCSNFCMASMIANDYGYDQTLSKQLEWKGPGTHLVLISSSGNSPNIVRGARWAKEHGVFVIGFTGLYDGGELLKLSDLSVHINTIDYEEAENYHHEVMHQVSRFLRGEE